MKKFTMNRDIQKQNLGLKGIMALFLLSGFQVFAFCAGKKWNEILRDITSEGLSKEIAGTDLSKPGAGGVDVLWAATIDCRPRHLEVILEEMSRAKALGVNYKKKEFPNIVRSVGRDGCNVTPLGYAIQACTGSGGNQIGRQQEQEIVKLLAGSPYIEINNVGSLKNGKKLTALVLALRDENPIIAQMLITLCGNRLDITTPNPESDDTPFHSAIQFDFKDLKEWLLDNLPIDSLYVKNGNKETPLHLAIKYGAVHLPEKLIEKVAGSTLPLDNLFAQDKDGNTPLHLAIMYKQAEVVRVLVQRFLSEPLYLGYLSIKNKKQETPFDLAVRNNDIAKIFSDLLGKTRKPQNLSEEEWGVFIGKFRR